MKRLILTLCIICYANYVHTQNYVGTWIDGDTTDVGPVYSPLGVSTPTGKPGSRQEYTHWTDANGIFWLYGGDNNHTNFIYSDLWKYDPSINEWTYVKAGTSGAVYGTKGVSAPGNSPGGRRDANSWMDLNGNLWMYGGYGNPNVSPYGSLNDLWKFDVTTNQWTWISGSTSLNQNPVYGTKGVPASSNSPGSLSNAERWVDANGDFWLYGGWRQYDGVGYSSMWKYTVSSNQWTWVQGSKTVDLTEVLGTMGVPDPNNTPADVYSAASWMDANGDMWLFSGMTGHNTISLPYLWKYDVATTNWTWMKGSYNDWFDHGENGVSSATSTPWRREEINACLDINGDAIIYSGDFDYGDLWKYEFSTNNWVWIGGTDKTMQNSPHYYGTKGVASFKNNPGGRKDHRIWSVPSGDIYLFGGVALFNNVYLPHDIWKFSPCALPETATVSPNSITEICSGNSVTVTLINSTPFTFFDDNKTQIGTGNSFVTPVLTANNFAKSFEYYAEASSTCAIAPPQTTINIWVHSLPNIHVATSNSVFCTGMVETLMAYGADTYTWNGIPSGDTFTVSPNHYMLYNVQGTDQYGCKNSSSLAVIPNTVTAFNYTINGNEANFSISNPACTSFTWDFGNGSSSSINPNPVLTYATNGTYGVCLKCNTLPTACLRCFNIKVPSNAMGGVGINEYGNAEYIYEFSPNPTKGKLRFESFKAGTIQIFSLSGAIILNRELQEGVHEFDLSQQSAGIYLVRYAAGGRTFTSRMVKE